MRISWYEIRRLLYKESKRDTSCRSVVDTHLDLAGELVFRLRNGEENPLRDIYLPAFRKGGFDLIVSSVYLQNHELPEGGLRAALEQIVVLKEQIRKTRSFWRFGLWKIWTDAWKII